jgi:hypothetical protein
LTARRFGIRCGKVTGATRWATMSVGDWAALVMTVDRVVTDFLVVWVITCRPSAPAGPSSVGGALRRARSRGQDEEK